VLEERYDTEGFDYALVFHCGDHESISFGDPLKAQGLATEEIVEHIPCGPAQGKYMHPWIGWTGI
jgi:hypothetical protein